MVIIENGNEFMEKMVEYGLTIGDYTDIINDLEDLTHRNNFGSVSMDFNEHKFQFDLKERDIKNCMYIYNFAGVYEIQSKEGK